MNSSADVRLITLDPAHFHAALAQKQMLPGICRRVAIYSPLGPDLYEHLKRIERFNTRTENPTAWELDVHCAPDPVERMRAERPGNVVVLAGRNHDKIGKIAASLDAGLNVLADKPWIIHARDLPALQSALETADRKGLAAYDMMTERYEITTLLQKELVNAPEVFGEPLAGSDGEPGVFMESVHHIMKTVAGVPGLRPAFFFDILQQGESLPDVGTHLVDMIPWTLFPEQAIRCPEEIEVDSYRRWATPLGASQFQMVTGLAGFPAELSAYVNGDHLDYYCNSQIAYKLRGICVKLNVLWNWESPAGVDLHHAVYRGSNAAVSVRQGEKENYRPEVYVTPNQPVRRAATGRALSGMLERLQTAYPGVGSDECGGEFRLKIPDRYRIGHEAHFAQVVAQFLEYLKAPGTMPAWERPNMIAKYYVTTAGSRKS
ncbi:MAG: oxidoreductase [Acidobacteriia bacterium]|nr:oxidoreductase [Terriglobia bacterium]